MLRSRPIVSMFTIACATALAGATAQAQEDTPKPATPAAPAAADAGDDQPTAEAPKTYPPYRRVPSNFGKVGLSNQQREDIYIIRGRYQSEIAELKARIEMLSQKEMDECVSVLTEAQRKLLDQIRAASRPALLGSGSNREN
ncbi:hypothetical protein [Tautonia marina]|uniref:hypothetical protein n=1 Tax=Tautonia marina TaxID=2653855 RepID=UPI0012613778|nr:hypothetical protein [Tautonia marina]